MPAATTALYPGTFDVLTCGHLDLIRRGAQVFPQLIVAVARNDAKQTLFTPAERCEVLRRTVLDIPNVRVDQFTGLTVEYCRREGIQAIIRGLRFVSDFEYELQMALMNRSMAPEVETLFLAPAANHSFISSSLVTEIVSRGGDVSEYVPPAMAEALRARFPMKQT